MAVIAVATAERALEITLAYVREAQRLRPADRLVPGQPLRPRRAGHRDQGRPRGFVDGCICRPSERRARCGRRRAAKLWTTELQGRVADRCLQLHGGYGYMDEYEISRSGASAGSPESTVEPARS